MFISDTGGSQDTFRRPLFTDEERRHMIQNTLRVAAAKPVSQILTEIELELERLDFLSRGPDQILQRGPFGVFRGFQANLPTNSLSFSTDDFTSEEMLLELMPLDLPSTNESLLDFDLGLALDCVDTTLLPDVPADSTMHSPGIYNFWPPMLDAHITTTTPRLQNLTPLFAHSDFPLEMPVSTFPVPGVPLDEVTFLLSRYIDSVIPLLSPVKRVKTIWHTVFLAGAMNTLAALTLKVRPSAASLAELFGVLSITAMSLRGTSLNSEWERWNGRGLEYLLKAERMLQTTLEKAFQPIKEEKYKTVLAAILCVTQASTFAGVWENTEKYLLSAERFIQLKGLSKKIKSRRVRFLHHCYGYLRIFYESTFVLEECTQRLQIREAIEKAGLTVPNQDTVHFRLVEWPLNLDQKMQEPKSHESGENDLHLSTPGKWSQSFYQEIYEIPESFLCLLSQIIRLKNEKDSRLRTLYGSKPIDLIQYMKRAKALEKCTCEWLKAETYLAPQTCSDPVVSDMLEALHQSLLIYFYRMIYDVDASTLRGHVELVREKITGQSQEENGIFKYTAVFVWPGFIAACEALDPAVQQSFAQWFESNINTSGLQVYSTVLQIIKQVWSRRRADKDANLSWVDILREEGVRLFWC